jgi:hypothetical protein
VTEEYLEKSRASTLVGEGPLKDSSNGHTAVYEPPRLDDLGPLSVVTLAEGNHFGKVTGGSDAFVMRGHGGLTTNSA